VVRPSKLFIDERPPRLIAFDLFALWYEKGERRKLNPNRIASRRRSSLQAGIGFSQTTTWMLCMTSDTSFFVL
jgi:hypothetical protein